MTLNGFEIEKYNQYGFAPNARTSTCPLCSETRKKKTDKCVKLYWDAGLGECFHCGDILQLHTYKKKKQESIKLYKKPVWKNTTTLCDAVVKWFETERKISQATLKKAKVSEQIEQMPPKWEKAKTICFNYFRQDELINIKYRTSDKRFKLFKDGELILYNMDNCISATEIVLVEGEIDALSYMEAGIYNVASLPNGSTLKTVNLEYIDNCIDLFENKTKIYLALDKDEAGTNVTKELIRRLGSQKCFLVDFQDAKDANEYLIRNGKESLKNTLNNALEIPLEGISSVLDWGGNFDDYIANGMQKGYTVGIQSFDEIFSTYTGQYIVVTGKPSSGKSDWVDQMCLGYCMRYGWKIAMASPENQPYQIHAGKILSKLAGQWVRGKEQLTKAWYKKGKEFMHDNFKYIELKRFGLTEVLEKAKQMIYRYGIKVLVIDPYNKVRLQESLHKNINDYTNDYLLMIDEFAKEHDILIFLVAHPVKPSGEERKTYEPDFYSIKGGGEFYDMSPHGILVHRDYEKEVVKIKTLKVKFNHLGENNKWVWMKWNMSNGRYTDFRVQAEEATNLYDPLIDNTNWLVEMEKNTVQSKLSFPALPQDDLERFKQREQNQTCLSYAESQEMTNELEQQFLSEPLTNEEIPF